MLPQFYGPPGLYSPKSMLTQTYSPPGLFPQVRVGVNRTYSIPNPHPNLTLPLALILTLSLTLTLEINIKIFGRECVPGGTQTWENIGMTPKEREGDKCTQLSTSCTRCTVHWTDRLKGRHADMT